MFPMSLRVAGPSGGLIRVARLPVLVSRTHGDDACPHFGRSMRTISELLRKRSKTISVPSGVMSNALTLP
jgi:hypothetical protein